AESRVMVEGPVWRVPKVASSDACYADSAQQGSAGSPMLHDQRGAVDRYRPIRPGCDREGMREAAPPRHLSPRPPPRHLSPRPPHARRPSSLLFELPVVMIVVVVAMGLLVAALNKHTQSSAAPFVPNSVENPSPSATG